MVKVNMKAAARILLFVTATFINTECFRTFDRRQDSGSTSIDEDVCPDNILDCESNLHGLPYIAYYQNFGTIAPHIDQICSDYRTGRQCLEQAPQSCQYYLDDFEITYQQMDFICSDRAKSLLREFQQSVCYSNFPDVWEYQSICTPNSIECSPNDNNVTPPSIDDCVINQFTAACGEAGGTLFSSLRDMENI